MEVAVVAFYPVAAEDLVGRNLLAAFLEVVPQQRLVFTSCLLADWRPATPWMAFTAIITLADEGAGTRYVAHVMHPDQATRDRHAEMGFFDGWNTCIDQLDAIALQLG